MSATLPGQESLQAGESSASLSRLAESAQSRIKAATGRPLPAENSAFRRKNRWRNENAAFPESFCPLTMHVSQRQLQPVPGREDVQSVSVTGNFLEAARIFQGLCDIPVVVGRFVVEQDQAFCPCRLT